VVASSGEAVEEFMLNAHVGVLEGVGIVKQDEL
jgi:hypothetical protein